MSYDTSLKPKQKLKLIKVVGHKPMIKLNLNFNENNFEELWDRGCIISLTKLSFIKTEFSDLNIESVGKFIGDKAPNLTLQSANSSKMEIVGVVKFGFEIFNYKNKFSIPFIVTNSDISKTIVGFNIIQNLVQENTSKHFNPILKLFPNLN